MTAAARKVGVFNPHHTCIAERGRLIRPLVDLGYSGVRSGRLATMAKRSRGRAEQGGSDVPTRP